jgi:hypothetical protein
MSDAPSSPGAFPSTAWALLRTGRHNEFLARYCKPVFVFLRARGYPPPQAEELTQEFFLHFLEKHCLDRADERRGRFRNYLLKILVRFLADQTPDRLHRQRAFERQAISLDRLFTEPAADESPETLFMRQWAVDLVGGVRHQLEEVCRTKGRADWYDLFTAFHPPTADVAVPAQEELARRLGITRDQVRYALAQTQEWFRILLRAEVRDQVDADEEADEEIRDLLTLLQR